MWRPPIKPEKNKKQLTIEKQNLKMWRPSFENRHFHRIRDENPDFPRQRRRNRVIFIDGNGNNRRGLKIILCESVLGRAWDIASRDRGNKG